MPTQRPLVGVTTEDPPSEGARVLAEAISSLGGAPLLLSPASSSGQPLHGLLLSGGGDIHASYYGAHERVAPRRLSRARDEFELHLCRQTRAAGRPILGICRGLQILVVAAGGRLFQHIPEEVPDALQHYPYSPGNEPGHLLNIQAGSRLASVLGAGPCFVNTSHHQAPSFLAGGLAASALSADGIVEAAEGSTDSWVVGVQWHPERMWDYCPAQKGLLEGLVKAAREWQSALIRG